MLQIVGKEKPTNISKTNRFTTISRAYRFTYISRIYRFVRIHRMYRFTNINRTNRFTTIVRKHWFTRISSKILELPGLLELTARTILSEFRRRIGLQTSTGRTLLLKLTGHTGLLGSIERISTGYIHKVTRNNRKYKCTRTNRASRFI